MKKEKILIILVFLITVFFVVACAESNEDNHILEPSIAESSTEEITEETSIINKINTTSKDDSEYYDQVEMNQTLELGFATIVFSGFSIDRELLPKNTSGVYMYLAENEGSKYIHLVGSVTNNTGEQFDVENIVVRFVFDDQYKYDGFMKADSGFMEAYDHYVDPMTSTDFHICAIVPDEVVTSFHNCKVRFGFRDNFKEIRNEFEYYIGNCDYKYEFQITQK